MEVTVKGGTTGVLLVMLQKMYNSNMIIYTTEDGLTKVDVTFEDNTVWLSIDQMAELFQRDRSVIGKHVRNIF